MAERVELITRHRCPLCDQARTSLLSVVAELRLGVSEFDVDEDRALLTEFTDRVPVIRFRGQVLAEGRVAPEPLRAALTLAASAAATPDDPVTDAGGAPGAT